MAIAGKGALGGARWIALLFPAFMLSFAFASEHWGMVACEMCWWQRYAHFVGLGLAVLAFALMRLPDRGRSFVWLSALAILTSGGIGILHAGCERKLWTCFTQCTAPPATAPGQDILADIMARPMVRCDDIQFELFGISMAGWNAILSVSAALLILWLSLKKPKDLAAA